MNKKDIMRQSSMEKLLEEMVKHQPGVTSQKLFDVAKEWAGKSWGQADTFHFDEVLRKLLAKGYRCTNKQWYPKGYVAARDPKGPPKEDKRQLRIDW